MDLIHIDIYDNPRVCLCVDVNLSVHVLEWSSMLKMVANKTRMRRKYLSVL